MPAAQSDASRVLGERIRAERVRLGVTQQELAELAGMHFTNIGKIERGDSNPTLHTIVRIAAVLDVDPAVFVAGIGADALPPLATRFTAADFVREREGRR